MGWHRDIYTTCFSSELTRQTEPGRCWAKSKFHFGPYLQLLRASKDPEGMYLARMGVAV